MSSPAAPLVLLRLKPESSIDTELYCPDHPSSIGIQFPPSGLVYLLMQSKPDGNGGFHPFEKLAFTGGPIPVDPEDAGGDDDLAEVCRLADLILMHDLKIWQSSGPSVQSYQPGLGIGSGTVSPPASFETDCSGIGFRFPGSSCSRLQK